jgi:hypothetical protein
MTAMSRPDDGMRASDRDRMATARALRGQVREGRLSEITFVRRLTAAFDARRRHELDRLVDDLPARVPWRRVWDRWRGRFRRLQPEFRPVQRMMELSFPPVPGQYVIGRAEQVDLHLDYSSVSRRHALLAFVDGGWMITDLGSRNGTWLNGWRLPGPAPVLAGDMLDIGCCRFVVVDRLSRLEVTPPLSSVAFRT